jgi:hypothetical protein
VNTSLLLILLAGAAPGTIRASETLSGPWPEVQEIHKTFYFDDTDKAGFDVTIKDQAGAGVYALKCHSGLYEGDPDFDYSGLFACRLASLYSKERVSTLLTETTDQPSDWENRGRYLASHLRPGCADYPEWGRTRTFRLRGMKLTLSVRDEKFGKSASESDILQSYTVDVTVRRDDTARTPIAQSTKVPEPAWFYSTAPCPKHEEHNKVQ